MTDVIFGGSTPKGNVVWVPTALPALATTLLDPSLVLIPIRKLFTLLRGTCLASLFNQLAAGQCQDLLHHVAAVRA
jgi:hypothetical protein